LAYLINEECINCAACEPECPNEAISEGETFYEIDSGRGTNCVGAFESSKCAEVCPLDACQPDPEHEETKEQLLAKWRGLHHGEEPTPGTY
jgi:ferredoxin